MIDFRYHMVSLAAVLIALAMGIVLGAGPLNDDIGNTLSGEVDQLRAEKDELRQQTAEQERVADRRDDYDEAVLDRVVGGRLEGRTVAVLRLPEVDDGTVGDIEDTLDEAGAARQPTISVDPSWAATGAASDEARAQAADAAMTALGQGSAGATALPEVLAAVVGARPGSTPVPDETRREAVFEALADAGLVGGEAPTGPSDLVVLVGGPVAGDLGDDGGVEPTTTAVATRWVELADAVDARSDGTVLAAEPAADASGDLSPVTLARAAGDLADGVSTVDIPTLAMGRAAVVLALVEQAEGGVGHYGTGTDASAILPDGS